MTQSETKKTAALRLKAILLISSCAVAIPVWGTEPNEREALAKAFVSRMAAGEFGKAAEPFDETMKQGLPAEKLKQVWESVTSQQGSFQQTAQTRTEVVSKYQIVFVTTEFERGKLDVKVVFDAENRIAGLFFVPAGKYERPPYVNPAAFSEIEIKVGKGLLPLSGTLALPTGAGPFPAVVLVHGSGPHDRDESIGPNQPFRDLAQGLASRGIAVLRYEKRTKQYQMIAGLFSGSITVKEETIDDVVAAVDTLASHERINKGRIFVLGHSLGGMLIPRIDKASDKIAGFISLAGSTRPLEDAILEQAKYILSLDGQISEEEQKQLEQLERQIAKVKSPDLSAQTPAQDLPLGVPANYWLDLRGYDPAQVAKEIDKPMLILQGERDYQVTMDDFGRWKQALASRSQVKFVAYPTLNHLFMDGKGKSVPAEYLSPGHVSDAVVGDIASWIESQLSK